MDGLTNLLEDISADDVCGDNLEYDPAYLELAKNIIGKPEDPITGSSAEPPNWQDIKKQSLSLLQRSKDLQVVIYLSRAAISLEGLPGFRDCLKLLHDLLEKYWDHIHPQLDPDDAFDPTARVNILEELNNFESVLRPLSLAPLADSRAVGRFGLRDIHLATDKAEVPEGTVKPDVSSIRAAFLDAPEETTMAIYQAIEDSIGLVQQLDALVGGKIGIENGPDLSGLASLLKEMRYACSQYVDIGSSAAEEEAVDEEEGGDSAARGPARKSTAVGAISTRQDVLKTLDLICKYYAETEPSSPVPILLNRAKYLVTADFMQIVHNLVPDGLSQLEQIKGPDPDAEEY
ncbi:MAG: type VI secretion system protein TssA [Methylomonas sp.]|nr:type VI secretion system protein TssA [Methylomonas sp.]